MEYTQLIWPPSNRTKQDKNKTKQNKTNTKRLTHLINFDAYITIQMNCHLLAIKVLLVTNTSMKTWKSQCSLAPSFDANVTITKIDRSLNIFQFGIAWSILKYIFKCRSYNCFTNKIWTLFYMIIFIFFLLPFTHTYRYKKL